MGIRKKFFYDKGGEALTQLALRHSWSGRMGLWQPDQAVGVPAHCRGVGLDGL